jgi:hypothetical protein
VGFELNIDFNWNVVVGGGGSVDGTAKLKEVSGDDLDELEVVDVVVDMAEDEGQGEADRQDARGAVHGMAPALREALEQLLQRMRSK